MRITSPYQFGIGVLGLVWATLNWYPFLVTGRPPEYVEPWSLLLLTAVSLPAVVTAVSERVMWDHVYVRGAIALLTLGLGIYQLAIDEVVTGVLLLVLAVVFYIDSSRVPGEERSSNGS